jgi:transposase
MLIREGINACSEDVYRKITKAVERGTGKKKSGAARTFGVSLSSVKRYVGMARREGLSLKRRPGKRPMLNEQGRPL